MSAFEGIQNKRKQIAKEGYKKERPFSSGTKASPGQPSQQDKKRKYIKNASIAGGIVFLILIIMFGCAPRKGTMMYGVCKVFTERFVDFPSTIDIKYVEQYPMAVRIGFTQIDAFGTYSNQMMECSFRRDPAMGLAMDSAEYNREPLPEEQVENFNYGIPAIVKSPPDLTLPPPLPDNLIDLKK
jgi:hypothetical protein